MKKLRQFLTSLPAGTLSMITIATIFWLTLAPKPLGDNAPKLFPGADKIAHAIMFGGLALTIMLDRQRKDGWKAANAYKALWVAVGCSLFGIAIEFLQTAMGLGRSFEIADIVSDTTGAFLFAYGFLYFQKNWLPKRQK